MKTRRESGKPNVLLAISSCFLPTSFSFLFSRGPSNKDRGKNGEGEGRGNKPPQNEACLPEAYTRVGRVPSPLRQATSLLPLLPLLS